jgi:hypothetical protein
MGRKIKCESSSSSSTCSSSSFVYCCKKYPTCKCAPIYYPNNCNPNPNPNPNPYPCNPCAPKICPPYPCVTNPCVPNPCGPPYPYPYPNPCVPNSCVPAYTVNTIIGTGSTSLAVTSPTVNVFNMSLSEQLITLPQISTLSTCNYTKMFVIANQYGSSNSFSVIPTSPDTIITGPVTLFAGQTVILYAVYVPNGSSFWVAQLTPTVV